LLQKEGGGVSQAVICYIVTGIVINIFLRMHKII